MHVGSQIGEKVVAVESRPELVVLCAVEERVEVRQLLHRFGQRVGRGVGLQRVRRK